MQQIAGELVKIQPRGVLTIPKKLRNELGLKENSIARLINEKGRLVVESVRTLPYPVRTYSDQEVAEFISLDAKETKGLKKKKQR